MQCSSSQLLGVQPCKVSDDISLSRPLWEAFGRPPYETIIDFREKRKKAVTDESMTATRLSFFDFYDKMLYRFHSCYIYIFLRIVIYRSVDKWLVVGD